jgi:outer membrane murein-binding lipoprotein Lpp
LITYLAAIVAIIALGGAVYLDQQNRARMAELSGQVAALKSAVDALPVTMKGSAPLAAPAPQPNDGTIEALLALQKRIAALEAAGVDPQTTGAIAPVSEASATGPAPEMVGKTQLADGPTKNCIPIGTRFLATAGDSYPICRTTAVVKIKDVTMEGVLLSSGKMVLAGETGPVGFGTCALNVVTTDMDGFADLKVTCT